MTDNARPVVDGCLAEAFLDISRGGYLCPTCEVKGTGTACWSCERPVQEDRPGLDPAVPRALIPDRHGPFLWNAGSVLRAVARIQNGERL